MHRSLALAALVTSLFASACEVTVRERGVAYYVPPPPPPRAVVISAAVPPPPPTQAPVVVVSHDAPPATAAACGYSCAVDVVHGTTSCNGAVRVTNLGSGRGLATIEMGPYHQLAATVTLSSPAGWSFDLGDSPTNDGWGGDAASRSNDAELFAVDGTLNVYGSDYGPTGDAKRIAHVPFGAGTHTILVEDQRIRDLADGLDLSAPYLLRLSPPMDQEGPPDRTWYMSFDGVISGRNDRVGHGLDRVDLCLR